MCFENKSFVCPECQFRPEIMNGIESFCSGFNNSTAGFSPADFAMLQKLETGSFWFRSRNDLIFWAMKRFFPTAKSFLEVGCGTGFILKMLENRAPYLELSGGEFFVEGLRCARSRLSDRVRLMQMDARDIPFLDEFDVVGAFDTLEHIRDDEKILVQMSRATKRGGIILTVPQHPWLWSHRDIMAKHERRYAKKELLQKLDKAGIKVVFATSFFTLLLPVLVLSRLRRMTRSNARQELTLPRFLDRVFEGVMAFERALIKWGLCFPTGGSLLIVGVSRDA